jgi:D-sedoheptulose 7-phosphate isomerase
MLTRTSLKAHSTEFAAVVASGIFTQQDGSLLPVDVGIESVLKLLTSIRQRNGNVYLVGNGGSAAVASHAATDFFKSGGMRALTLHDPSTLTCFSNDYGYENAFSKRLARLLTQEDILIAISSSGLSNNILNAVCCAKESAAHVVTLSGFSQENKLRCLGTINYWLDSDDYGMVEIGHLFLLHHIADLLSLEWNAENGT